MRIHIGDICIVDPTNTYYNQNEAEAINYVVVIGVQGVFFKRYACVPCDASGEVIYDGILTLPGKSIVKVDPDKKPTVVIRNPANLPTFSEADMICIDQLSTFFDSIKDQDGIEVTSIMCVLRSLRTKIKYYYDLGFKEEKRKDGKTN